MIEVLVCIAVLAIISVPIFKGLQVSAILNSNADTTQKITAYAQKELETIKGMTVEEYVKNFQSGYVDADGTAYSYVTSGEVWEALNNDAEAIKNNFTAPGNMSEDEVDALFTPFICEKENIKIGSKTYKMLVKFLPAEYSQADQSTAANVNVAGYYDVSEADAVRFPVISDKINMYDETCVASLKNRLLMLGDTKSDDEIMGDMRKTVKVEIISPSSVNSSGSKMSVRCDVVYAYPADTPRVELNYCVYSATYDLEPDEGSNIGEESGGRVFIFARAFKDSVYNQCINDLIIASTGNTDVYFVLGSETGSSISSIYNFNSIELRNDATSEAKYYSSNYNLNLGIKDSPGQTDIPGTTGTFYCNIKSDGEVLNNSDEFETIGAELYRVISYAVKVEMYEQTEESVRVAYLEAAKVN